VLELQTTDPLMRGRTYPHFSPNKRYDHDVRQSSPESHDVYWFELANFAGYKHQWESILSGELAGVKVLLCCHVSTKYIFKAPSFRAL